MVELAMCWWVVANWQLLHSVNQHECNIMPPCESSIVSDKRHVDCENCHNRSKEVNRYGIDQINVLIAPLVTRSSKLNRHFCKVHHTHYKHCNATPRILKIRNQLLYAHPFIKYNHHHLPGNEKKELLLQSYRTKSRNAKCKC